MSDQNLQRFSRRQEWAGSGSSPGDTLIRAARPGGGGAAERPPAGAVRACGRAMAGPHGAVCPAVRQNRAASGRNGSGGYQTPSDGGMGAYGQFSRLSSGAGGAHPPDDPTDERAN